MRQLIRPAMAAGLALAAIAPVCAGQHYKQTTLVSSTGKTPDADLINPWGMSRGSGSPWWVSDAGTGKSTLYTGNGTKGLLVVTIPSATAGKQSIPTGTIYNGSTTSFLLAKSVPAVFLFCTIDGTVSGWNPALGVAPGKTSMKAAIVAKGKKGSVYTGMTSAQMNGAPVLYLANAGRGTVDVFDATFKPVKFTVESWEPTPFTDDLLPPNYVPYNVQAIGSDIVVTYAMFNGEQEVDGPGMGYVDIYSSTGYLKQHLEHGDWLNAPWGVALAPTDFGRYSHSLLIGEFAGGGTTENAGTIAAYDLATGRFEGLLENAAGKPLAINGLWALSPGNASPNNLDPAASPAAQMYFTAGPKGGSQGLFGYITATAADLTQGNDQ